MTFLDIEQACEKPRCRREPEKRYTDENGNKIQVCERHYWELVK